MAITFTGSTAVSPVVDSDGSLKPASTGSNNPHADMYSTFTGKIPVTTSLDPADLGKSLNLNVYDPAGSGSRYPRGDSRNLTFKGPWVDPAGMVSAQNAQLDETNEYYKYNQMLMTYAQNFDVFTQRKEIENPRWWFSRIPRGAFQLFNGLVQETRIYRGGLTTYAGLSQWEDINPYPDGKHDPCAPMQYDTYNYAWETLAWKGKRAGWGSDPICLDTLKFVNKAVEQLGWILDTGVNYGIDMQEVWNRDMFIYQSVQAGHSYLMTSDFGGMNDTSSARFVYQPFCKFGSSGADGVADKSIIDKPFIVFDASVSLEPLNFDVLDQVREYLKTMARDSAVGTIGGEPMYALAVSHDDVERYIRANEEERKYWIEANPQALIQHYGFAPSTFRRWSITNDGNQLRFKLNRYIAKYTSTEAVKYGNVGLKEFENKPVWIAEYVPPRIGGRPGVNGALVPTANPEYYTAEIAIAPVFMNKIFTNLFVPSVNTLGSGTYFGPVTGLNGKWAWRNIVSWDKNPEGKIGNFYGTFEIVPKPDVNVYEATSFLYRRCTKALPSYCPEQNAKVNPTGRSTNLLIEGGVEIAGAGELAQICIPLIPGQNSTIRIGDKVSIEKGALKNGETATTAATEGYVISTPNSDRIVVQLITKITVAASAKLTTVADKKISVI